MPYLSLRNLNTLTGVCLKPLGCIRNYSQSSSQEVVKIPKLLTPIGLAQPPLDSSYAVNNKQSKLTAGQRQDKILREMRGSIVQDISEVQEKKGKLFYAPPRVFKKESSLWMYNFEGKSLSKEKVDLYKNCLGKPFILLLFGNSYGENQCKQWITGIDKVTDFPVFFFNVQSNILKYFLTRMFSGSIKRSLPSKESWNNYVIALNRRLRYPEIQWNNRLVGNVFLLDESCKIRWAATGFPTEKELTEFHAACEFLKSQSNKE
ncbi:F1-F0 ATPase assembly protein [Schizosaccharomyces cryophilus OY26]|uniref:F1-F0 ATPase assembly protein n=1 Tax=Schizosaccharomyces cryophilus (strain OY26 / ATCC MYA-4695 / CBS 11777 / NBRC 106824 / NRRL Y48691) TaxID=653667 RepID=S9W676_SCHCR|nr:F1-F0 ATPase assembly protein [Schizosaccharomyces cryophilus OY26]EPY54074.1 F1-F0 ATPase assembly protein [Schizosaccharomyces cryophilus OY26]